MDSASVTTIAAPVAEEPDMACRRADRLHPAMRRYVESVTRILDRTPVSEAPTLVTREKRQLLAERGLLYPAQRASDPHHYRRHLIYAEPRGRFSVLVQVWGPDQGTSVQGLRAWGAMGVYIGHLSAARYRTGGDGAEPVEHITDSEFSRGECGSFPPGADGIHRLHNRSYRLAVSIHTFGMDLAENPAAINRIHAA